MAQLSNLIIRRGHIKGKLTRFKTYLDELESHPDLIELKSRLARIEPCCNDFEDIQSDIACLCKPEEQESHETETTLFEEGFYKSTARAKHLIAEHTPNQNIQGNSQIISGAQGVSHVKLPTIHLPQFSGAYDQWLNFYDTFNSLIHANETLSKIQKFHYLRSSLKNEAARVIHALDVSESNYDIAWALLKERFENKRLIIHNHVKALFDLPVVTREAHTALRQTLDNVLKNLRALTALKEPTEHWGTLLIYLVTTKLDQTTKREWEASKPASNSPSFEDLTKFLTNRCNLLETLNINKPMYIKQQPSNPSHNTNFRYNKANEQSTSSSYLSFESPACLFCKGKHLIFNCQTFLALSNDSRTEEVLKLKLCMNCLKPGHFGRDCRSRYKCKTCYRRHNTLLHTDESSNSTQNTPGPVPENQEQVLVTNHCSHKHDSQILLSTALVLIYDKVGNTHECRVLLDSGSQSNFITQELCQQLQLTKQKINLPVSGINSSLTAITSKTQAKIQSRYNSFKATLTCLILPRITENLPITSFSVSTLQIPGNINLADPTYNQSSKTDLLLGAEIFWELMCVGQIRLGRHQPILQKTHFGWLMSGTVTQSCNTTQGHLTTCHLTTNIEEQLSRFWQIEECQELPIYSKEETDCEQHFVKNTTRDTDGRFIVRLPFKNNIHTIGASREAAQKRFFSLERRLQKQPLVRDQYSTFMTEYEALQHMQSTSSEEQDKVEYYLPHHAVFKETSLTTKLRVVFDGSANTSTGISLNDTLMVGPTIQQDLFSIVVRFRKHNFVITADITKMYRQIQVHPDDQGMQKIIWRKQCNEPLQTYKLSTVTYGTASAPFLATRCLKQLAIDECNKFPEASEVTLTDFYVDDLLSGSHTLDRTIMLRDQLISLLKGGGFELAKWASNDPRLLLGISGINKSTVIDLDGEQQFKTLGLLWKTHSDTLEYSVKTEQSSARVTKRAILSSISQIFDPLGLIGPATIKAKILLQKLWQIKIGWDESVPIEVHTTWVHFRNKLESINQLKVPRHTLCTEPVSIEIHGFSDASEAAYGACIYIRSTDSTGNHTVRLLCAKSRVAPLKSISIPRLELCGAQLLSKLTTKVIKSLDLQIHRTFYWCDSTIVLAWISTPANQLKTFVANRVSEIQGLTQDSDWRHVSTKENPADIISRGINPDELLAANLWWEGPRWLSDDMAMWPNITIPLADVPERKITTSLVTTIQQFDIYSKYSSLTKLQRVTAYCLRFRHNSSHPPALRRIGSLTAEEIQQSLVCLLKGTQLQEFRQDIQSLQASQTVTAKSRLLTLNPFLDSDQLIRVGGRISKAHIPYNQRHQLLLPSKHPLTGLIIQHEHCKLLHAGPQAVLASLRLNYWPLSGYSTVKLIIRNCIRCFRHNPPTNQPLMGELPEPRIVPSRPFSSCGVDYAGPFGIKEGRSRRAKIGKAYLCIFVCFSTKAVHLELVSDLTTEAFLASLRRFIARRGKCLHIYSDNATNFVGSNNELTQLANLLNDRGHQNKVQSFLSNEAINWHFIPPNSPNFGGLWESAVKSAKRHLKRVASEASLTFEELSTLFTQIEACLNSRPLTPLSSDPNDLNPLTPAHFLIGDSLVAPPQHDLREVPINRLARFQRVQQLVQHFWSRWSKEYLTNLQQRSKWKINNHSQVQQGTLVIIRDDNLPPFKWKMGKILQLHPGTDGINRVVTIKTAKGIIKRAVSRVCALPICQ